MYKRKCDLRRIWRLFCILLLIVSLGCSNDGVREDRSVNYDAQGGDVGFQHGDEGVFVAEGENKVVKKIFDSAGSIAVSSPLWSPVDKRLIFSAAYPKDKAQLNVAQAQQAWDTSPEGRVFFGTGEAVKYSCLLRGEPATASGKKSETDRDPPGEEQEASTDLSDAQPVVLFEASCSHSGYVAANLAIRWRPDGKAIYFVDLLSSGRHGLFEYDLETKKTKVAMPHQAEHLIFDWSPNGKYLFAVLSDSAAVENVGVWLRKAGEKDWWKAPQTTQLANVDESLSLIERLRASKPAWTSDERVFASVQPTENAGENKIVSIAVEDRQSTELFRSASGLSGLHWRPDGEILGFAEGDEFARLRFVDQSGNLQNEDLDESGQESTAIADASQLKAERRSNRKPMEDVRQFVGWNAEGSQFAFVSPDNAEPKGDHFAFLFPRIANARDRVYVATNDSKQPARLVHSGLRITFPKWSPAKNELSLWGTYTPTHRSWLSMFLPWTLRPGDPAAILDISSNQVTWMAVNPHEQAQVGHYYLLKGEYERAWEWYQKSASQRGPAKPIKLSELPLFLRQVRIHQDPTFFEYVCLAKMGRKTEAANALKRFKKSMRFELDDLEALRELGWLGPPSETVAENDAENDAAGRQATPTGEGKKEESKANQELRRELEVMLEFITPVIQDSYAAEVFLSLNAADEGVAYFRREAANAGSDSRRLLANACLSQMLLATDDFEAYRTLVVDELAPAIISLYKPQDLELVRELQPAQIRRFAEQAIPLAAAALASAPLLSSEFLDHLELAELESMLGKYDSLRKLAKDPKQVSIIDIFRMTILAKLDRKQQWREVADNLKSAAWLQISSNLDLADHKVFLQNLEEALNSGRAMAR